VLKLEVINDATQHFIISGDEPFRIEVSILNGNIITHVYHGADVDLEQDPDLCYDGSLLANVDQTSTNK